MKLSDWCVLFAGLFVCLILGMDLKIRYLQEAQSSMELYHRNVDRAAEDALFDCVLEENADGSICMDTERAKEQFMEQVWLDFEAVVSAEQTYFAEHMRVAEAVSEQNLSGQMEAKELVEKFEQSMNEGQKEQTYQLHIPAGEQEEWHQRFAKNSFYAFFETDDATRHAWLSGAFAGEVGNYVRYCFSGGRIRKTPLK